MWSGSEFWFQRFQGIPILPDISKYNASALNLYKHIGLVVCAMGDFLDKGCLLSFLSRQLRYSPLETICPIDKIQMANPNKSTSISFLATPSAALNTDQAIIRPFLLDKDPMWLAKNGPKSWVEHCPVREVFNVLNIGRFIIKSQFHIPSSELLKRPCLYIQAVKSRINLGKPLFYVLWGSISI